MLNLHLQEEQIVGAEVVERGLFGEWEQGLRELAHLHLQEEQYKKSEFIWECREQGAGISNFAYQQRNNTRSVGKQIVERGLSGECEQGLWKEVYHRLWKQRLRELAHLHLQEEQIVGNRE